jgi:hypothetical protein
MANGLYLEILEDSEPVELKGIELQIGNSKKRLTIPKISVYHTRNVVPMICLETEDGNQPWFPKENLPLSKFLLSEPNLQEDATVAYILNSEGNIILKKMEVIPLDHRNYCLKSEYERITPLGPLKWKISSTWEGAKQKQVLQDVCWELRDGSQEKPYAKASLFESKGLMSGLKYNAGTQDPSQYGLFYAPEKTQSAGNLIYRKTTWADEPNNENPFLDFLNALPEKLNCDDLYAITGRVLTKAIYEGVLENPINCI